MAFLLPYSICFLVLILYSATAQTRTNITLGSSLTAQPDHNVSWLSPSGDFAFGFQKVGNGDAFLLAIWFDRIPEKTIVWSANRNDLVPKGSKLELTDDGRLVLTNPKNKQIWSASSSDSQVSNASMLDTGNLVLVNQNGTNLWTTFDQPTDTILPTQKLSQAGKLIARYAETNYSTGRFLFSLQPDGNLVLYTTHYPLDTSNNFAYWSTQTSIGSGFQVIFNQSGYVYLVARNGSILNLIFSNEASTHDFYQRVVLDYDGVLRQYVYPKSGSASEGKWAKSWSILSDVPSNICTRIQQDTGGGACGFNSYCIIEDDQSPNCLCPPGYAYLDPDDVSQGCKQSYVSQNCDDPSKETDLFELREMQNTDWPLSDYEYYQTSTENECRGTCLSDCFCAVAIFRDGECWKKRIPLSNGRTDPSTGGKALIKVRKSNSTLFQGPKNKDQSPLIITGSVLLGTSFVFNLTFLVLICIIVSRFNRRKLKFQHKTMPTGTLKCFTYQELEKSTGGFKEELGSGAFGIVYKGVSALENKEFVAVKKLNKMTSEGEVEFKAEVSAIGRIHHKNLVQLLGFCDQGQNRLLVYEYMSNGSLANFLFGNPKPNWYKREQIAFGIARGLLYLHEECSSQIIHCDIKPQNVLLDDSFTAKISDFGLAKLLKADQTRTTTAIRGTKGYVAPEWFRNLPITVKVDVYSFGVMLLELVCCRKNFDPETGDERQMILVDWAYDCYREQRLDLLVQHDEEARDEMKMVEKFVVIAIWCIQEDPSLRPTMRKVAQMMEGAGKVPVPPDPTSFISSV